MAGIEVAPPQIVELKLAAPGLRLASLDVFRGLTIAAMMLVNNAGDWNHVFWPLDHSEWNGWTPTDLIFPFFLFIVGVCLSFSFVSRQLRGESRAQLLLHSVQRSSLILLIGLFLAGFPVYRLASLRYYGVLQRIAVVYLIVSGVTLYLGKKAQVAVAVSLLLGYWAAIKLIPVPGCGAGVLTMDCSLPGFLDRQLLYNHLWVRHRFDPEGMLSTLPAVATCLIGVFVGKMLRSDLPLGQKLRLLFSVGASGLLLGEVWSWVLPINKNLWTSSYVVFTAGFAMVVLGLCMWLVDAKGWTAWGQPWLWMGRNPLALYAASSLLGELSVTLRVRVDGRLTTLKGFVYEHLFAHVGNPYVASASYGLAYVVTFLVLGWFLYRNRIFLKV